MQHDRLIRCLVIAGVGAGVLLIAWLISRSLLRDNLADEDQVMAQIEQWERRKDEKALRGATDHANPKIAARAVVGLARVKGREAGAAYLAGMLDDKRDLVREASATEYGSLGDRSNVKPLVDKGMKDAVPAVRVAAAKSLGRLEAWDGMEPLIVALDDENVNVRRCAISAIHQVLNGLRFNYNANDPPDRRQAVQARIRKNLPGIKPAYDDRIKKRSSSSSH